MLLGLPSGPYEGGIFFISIRFPPDYPLKPPMVSWKTPILHPNIDKPRVFHPLLVTATWKVETTVKELLQALHDMLLNPKVQEEDNYLADVARMCVFDKILGDQL
ncbi:ubiquitin-conjugating enzyme E2 11-like [Eutrema salsugineum]|uniref:ubiquitin-conjugating enzyme E2 11-like n=1 Tax=Eutrema salsugineum TaxID=72664 RepID=UPI000CECF452|nr:ubiquitin-conjugating enzyme E2 11-like [Eutrema salsugineum]